MLESRKLRGDWITGFVDGEGCFSISFRIRKKMRLGFEVRPSFSVSQKNDKLGVNYTLLLDLKDFFGVGEVRYSRIDQTWKYEVRSINHLVSRIIPFFELYILESSKRSDFNNFCSVIRLIRTSHHLSKDGIIKVLDLSFAMNVSGKRKYTKDVLLKLVNKVKV
jgi:hypothetical protein